MHFKRVHFKLKEIEDLQKALYRKAFETLGPSFLVLIINLFHSFLSVRFWHVIHRVRLTLLGYPAGFNGQLDFSGIQNERMISDLTHMMIILWHAGGYYVSRFYVKQCRVRLLCILDWKKLAISENTSILSIWNNNLKKHPLREVDW